MFGQIFGAIGSFIGGQFGGGILSTVGRFFGKNLGEYIDHLNDEDDEEYLRYRNVKNGFYLNIARYGENIPLIFGHSKVIGKIIWADEIKIVENKEENNIINCEYFISCAFALCEGSISEMGRIWANDKIIDVSNYKISLYYGDENQLPDKLIASKYPKNKVPAFRGLAYIIFEELALKDFGDILPNFSFEIMRKTNISSQLNVEDLVKSIVMIPGSGEFVYDTIIQNKIIKTHNDQIICDEPINSHNYKKIANSLHSLNQLQTTCSNIEWIAPVVCWFGDNLNIEFCSIKPYVEIQDEFTFYSEEWHVANYTRNTAKLVSRDERQNPNYGGTVNDASILRYLQELKTRKLKIMFYSMIFLDIQGKPWRGHLSGDIKVIKDFFCKEDGYNNFILHYAKLTKDYIDAFVIGSELIGLTKIRDDNNSFPAVDELIQLAKIVREILPKHVKIIYAADWSEYHHTEGGWYNMDKLFASEYIDVIGIDAYFPITDSNSNYISELEIKNGFDSGENYDYYIDGNGNKCELSPSYALKNLEYWWKNYHYNPDGSKTLWVPKMKKIWFTEFGFPSIDKSTNQPNIFYDPKSRDGGVPKNSNGQTDFAIQRNAIKAFYNYWNKKEFIEEMFLWTWDARPYPAWPCLNIWRDNNLWEKGHWVNNKFTSCNLSSLLLELSSRANIDVTNIDVSSIDEAIYGVHITKSMTIIDLINLFRICYFFDVVTCEYKIIKFSKRLAADEYHINSQDLLELNDETYLKHTNVSNNNIINDLHINFIDRNNEYKNMFHRISDNSSFKKNILIKLPIILSKIEISAIGDLIIKNAKIENQIIEFSLPITDIYINIKPGQFIKLNYRNINYKIRIISISMSLYIVQLIGVIDDLNNYKISYNYKF
jgi:hypothetical protein